MKVRRDGDGVVVDFDRQEQAVLADEFTQLAAQLPDLDPAGAVWQRLHPAVADDAEAAAEFRSMVDADLDAGRTSRLATCRQQLVDAPTRRRDHVRVILTAAELMDWVTALNDLRLTRGTELGVTADNAGRWDAGYPQADRWAVYHWLTAVQDALVTAAM